MILICEVLVIDIWIVIQPNDYVWMS